MKPQLTRKVLVVEDHPDMQKVLVSQMEWLGFRVIVAGNAQQGIEKALQEKPDLILLDIMMPEPSGIEVARRVRASVETRHIPILAVTALFRESELKNCIEEGCNDY